MRVLNGRSQNNPYLDVINKSNKKHRNGLNEDYSSPDSTALSVPLPLASVEPWGRPG